VPLLKFWVRRSPRPLAAAVDRAGAGRLAKGLGRSGGRGVGNRGKGFGQGHRLGCRAGWEGVGTKPECAVKSIDAFLTSLSRIHCEALPDRLPRGPHRRRDGLDRLGLIGLPQRSFRAAFQGSPRRRHRSSLGVAEGLDRAPNKANTIGSQS
jgi:hypothetical protein